MRRALVPLAVLAFLAQVILIGCSGDDGSTGPAGATGAPGAPGAGATAQETCVLCHASTQQYNASTLHRLDSTTGERIPPGTINVTVDSIVFGAPSGDNVPVTVNFTFAAADIDGNDITSSIDLRAASSGSLSYLRFTLAKLVAGANGDADSWWVFTHRPGQSGSGPYYDNRSSGISGTPATGVYQYVFPAGSVRVSDGFVDNTVVRAVVEVRALPITLFTSDPFYNTGARRPIGVGVLDRVAPIGGGTGTVPTAAYPKKVTVSTAACNACHDQLAIHGGSRREYTHCQACHNPRLEALGWDNSDLMNMVHKIHNHQMEGAQNLGELGDFSEVTYPQDIRNCTRCHQGTAADNTYDNWKNRPNRAACGSCHINVYFGSGALPAGKVQHPLVPDPSNSSCATCHPPTGDPPSGSGNSITNAHATENSTPNNPQLRGTLATFEYGIDEVTVDASNVATIKFWIKKDGAYVNLGTTTITRPSGFSGGPSFLFAYALPQDGITAPADYNNLGRAAGQPQSLSIIGLPISAYNPDFSQYTVQRANAFPAGATMRAVALQGYFTQISGGPGLDNVGRHTFSVHKAVTGDAVRRVAVESGYSGGQPTGCLQCHEIFEGHGGNRVSNAQVCVMCHNPNLSTSARTITTTPINPAITALFGTNPLLYPEVPNNFKELIHGLHGAQKRTTNFVDIRNRLDGVLLLGDEITYPGDISRCGKCHLNNLYQAVETTNRLVTTAKTTTGDSSETVAQINAARAGMPNATDEVISPATSACGHCHDSDAARSHFVLNGGKIRSPRSEATATPPSLNRLGP
jgi:OmcA/MtrC family decaheme c-type cytochrome